MAQKCRQAKRLLEAWSPFMGTNSRNSLKNSLFAGNLAGDRFDRHCVASQAFTRPEIVVNSCAKSLHFSGTSHMAPVSKALKIRNFGENIPRVSSPHNRNSRFRGDDRRRRVRSRLRGGFGSRVPAIASPYSGANPQCDAPTPIGQRANRLTRRLIFTPAF